MREIRTSGLTRGEVDIMHGMRILSHKRGNPETEVGRNLNIVSPLLLYWHTLAIDMSKAPIDVNNPTDYLLICCYL